MIGQCKECGQDIELCSICGKGFHKLDSPMRLEFEKGRITWGPIHDYCLTKVNLEKVRKEIGETPRLTYHPIPHSRDVTERHDMRPLLDDVRTRPTEPPDSPICGYFIPGTFESCSFIDGHPGDHSWEHKA